jgi:hypothetical protein
MDDLLSPGRAACPVECLAWYSNGTLSAAERAAIESHLAHCEACQRDVADWSALHTAMQSAEALTPQPRADLFSRIEQGLDVRAPHVVLRSRLHLLLQTCRFLLAIGGEHFRVQTRLIRSDLFWMPLFLVPLISTMVFLPPWRHAPGTAALLTALLTALGMAFLYGQEIDPVREMALVTPTPPHLILGVRYCLVFGYDLLLNCGLVLPFLTLQGIVTPAWFLTNWLAPLCCLSAIALLLSILVNASTAVLVCLLLWALRLFNSIQTFLLGGGRMLPQAPWQQAYENFWHQGPLLFVIAALLVLLTFLALERKERLAQ